SYTVTVATPSGFSPTLTGAGTTATDSNGSPASDITLAAGESNQTIDFGYYQPASIGNFLWNDLNHNGVQDGGEPGISGVTVTLSGTASGTTITDANGFYQFSNLIPGNYTVTVTTPAGFSPTLTGAGTTAT